jgi:formylglycine-generating enzyme required for sulfatase activity
VARAKSLLGPGAVHGSLGNPAITSHRIARSQCLASLRGVVVQTSEQRAICGESWEAPIYGNGDAKSAKACIDQFEYPNRPCQLPMVFVTPINAQQLCALNGERLCTQDEWTTACEADPTGGAPSKYAYGNELDLAICNTGADKDPGCDAAHAPWQSCPTDSVPTGSFAKCRSRLGVFDMAGNVAEIMTRPEKATHTTWVQFKGSAFFYDGKMYPDTCRFDPRWHVDPVDQSWHTMYHLGFRCCRDLAPK